MPDPIGFLALEDVWETSDGFTFYDLKGNKKLEFVDAMSKGEVHDVMIKNNIVSSAQLMAIWSKAYYGKAKWRYIYGPPSGVMPTHVGYL